MPAQRTNDSRLRVIDLARKVNHASRLLTAAETTELYAVGLDARTYSALRLLATAPGRRMATSRLARALVTSAAAAHRTTRRLRDEGLILLSGGETAGRVQEAELTAAGLVRLREAQLAISGALRRLLIDGGISEEAMKELEALLPDLSQGRHSTRPSAAPVT